MACNYVMIGLVNRNNDHHSEYEDVCKWYDKKWPTHRGTPRGIMVS